ncbi:MAG: hypothetical protein AMXMBFR4_07350 [Candidatus Hydrogenedentota bacterium]
MNRRVRTVAAGLMLLSGVTHVAQLFVYPSQYHVIGAATFGGIYFLIGLFLLGRRRAPLWFGAILPAIGGILGIIRFINLHRNPFSVFHVLIDLIVVPACIYLLTRKTQPE